MIKLIHACLVFRAVTKVRRAGYSVERNKWINFVDIMDCILFVNVINVVKWPVLPDQRMSK